MPCFIYYLVVSARTISIGLMAAISAVLCNDAVPEASAAAIPLARRSLFFGLRAAWMDGCACWMSCIMEGGGVVKS